MSSSTKINNKQIKKYILILGKGTTQGSIQLILQSIIKISACACIIMKQIVIYLLMVYKFINLK